VLSLLDQQRRAKQRKERKRKKARKVGDEEEVEPTGRSAVNPERRMGRLTKTKSRCQNKIIYPRNKEECN